MMSWLRDLALIWRTLVIVVVPLAALPVLLTDGSKEMSCLYGVILVAVFWMTEVMPLPVTALCPVVIFSLLGVLPARQIAPNYVKDASIFSLSCLTFALCVEKWNLHRRIALNTMLLMGSSPKWLLLGFMLPTWFLSMWVNNTSATAMMIPIVMAVLQELRLIQSKARGVDTNGYHDRDERSEDAAVEQHQTPGPEVKTTKNMAQSEESIEYPSDDFRNLCKSLSICICYSASIGGSGSLTGTSTNLVMQGQAEEIFGSYGLPSEINFLNWLIIALPVSMICLLITWIWLLVHFFGFKELCRWGCGGKEETEATRNVIRRSLNELGPLSFAEKAVIGHFAVLVTLWLSMKMPGGVGWNSLFTPGFVNNSTSGVIILTSLFIFPSQRPRIFGGNSGTVEGNSKSDSCPTLLEWENVQQMFPWGTFCLIGGGYALAATCQKSGLSEWIGVRLSALSSMEPWLMLLILTLAISFLTEVTSNAATASILGPILAELALNLGMNPLYLMVPGVLASSMAFMLPVATPPNTIVFATGHIKASDMGKAGFILNVLCVLVINVGANTWIWSYLNLDQLPPEMNRSSTALPTLWAETTPHSTDVFPTNVTA